MDEKRKKIQELRYEFAGNELDETEVFEDPVQQFEKWFAEAVEAKVDDPNAFTLCTVMPGDYPSARVVLLKDYSSEGFSFFTNYKSSKAHEINQEARVCMNFFWPELFRQVRINGIAEKLSAEESDEYFRQRPRGSQVAAWASEQSARAKDRKEMLEKFAAVEERFEGMEIPRPEFWGGYLVKPVRFEFWQGRMNRFHDRVVYEINQEKNFSRYRVMP